MLFLTELVIVILFFSLSAAVCVKIFATSELLSRTSYDINKSVVMAQNAAECFKAADADIYKTAQMLGGAVNESTIKIAYDKNWQISESKSVFEMIINIKSENAELKKAEITVYKNNKILYELTASHLMRKYNEH